MSNNPMFQHRHYAAIAAVLATTHPNDIKHALSSLFARDNPRFDPDRFWSAANGAPSNGRDRRAHV